MIYELNEPEYTKVQPILKGLNYHLVIFSIIEGNSPGRIFVDDVDHPQSALIWDKVEGGFYLAGDENGEGFRLEHLKNDDALKSLHKDKRWIELLRS